MADNGDVELSSYDSYWQGNPTIKTVHAKYLTDEQSKVSALQSGEVSALMNVADDQLSALSDTSKYTLHQQESAWPCPRRNRHRLPHPHTRKNQGMQHGQLQRNCCRWN